MNGRADSTADRQFRPNDQSTEGRRHRHRHAPGAGTWTPTVPTTPRRHRHGAAGPVDPPAHGTLPVGAALPVQGARRAPDAAEFAAVSGQLPIPPQPSVSPTTSAPAAPATPPRALAGPAARRTAVSLTAPASSETAPSDDERPYVVPAAGLASFDLGSVPASITPPRSWRRAAWFASLASGGVVVSLLLAGTMLVGQAPNDEQVVGWTDRHGGVGPSIEHEWGTSTDSTTDGSESRRPGLPGSPDRSSTDGTNRSGQDPTTDTYAMTDPGNGIVAPSETGEPGTTGGSSSAPPETTAPTTTVPEKPAVRQAPMSKAPQRYVLTQHDPQTLNNNSQDFLNLVTEDPAQAYALTTGERASGGVESLRQDYAGVAYFVVKHVYVDQNDGYTINTVQVTYDDGTQSEETRKLKFSDNDKIANDGA